MGGFILSDELCIFLFTFIAIYTLRATFVSGAGYEQVQAQFRFLIVTFRHR